MGRKTNTQSEKFTVLLNSKDEVVAFINPANHVKVEDLVASMTAKGLKVETREPSTDTRSTEL